MYAAAELQISFAGIGAQVEGMLARQAQDTLYHAVLSCAMPSHAAYQAVPCLSLLHWATAAELYLCIVICTDVVNSGVVSNAASTE
jgi:hypothetical protein